MDQIKEIYTQITNPLLVWGTLGLCILIALFIFFMNFKKKAGLIYIAIALILAGSFLVILNSVSGMLLENFVPEYAELVTPVIGVVLKQLPIIGYSFLAIAVVCIVAFILLKKKAK